MSKSKVNVPEAKAALDKFKMQAANEVGVTLKQGYNGDITAKEAGSIGGQMVKKMVESYENNLKTNGKMQNAKCRMQNAECIIDNTLWHNCKIL